MMKNATGVSLILAACLAVPAVSQADATTFVVRGGRQEQSDVRLGRSARDDDRQERESQR